VINISTTNGDRVNLMEEPHTMAHIKQDFGFKVFPQFPGITANYIGKLSLKIVYFLVNMQSSLCNFVKKQPEKMDNY